MPIGSNAEVQAVWQWHGKEGWKRTEKIPVPKLGTLRRTEPAKLPSDVIGPKPSSAMSDRYGVVWWLVDGKQLQRSVPGRSITDACLAWEETLPMFAGLADAVRKRRCGARAP